jgi:hypothetical protein
MMECWNNGFWKSGGIGEMGGWGGGFIGSGVINKTGLQTSFGT